MIRRPFHLLAALVASLLLCAPVAAFETRAKAAYVVDVTTGTILLAKNADEALPPASMSKLMTLYVAFEAVRDGRLRLDEKLPVSQHAMSFGGSTMFLNTRDRVSVEDLLRGIIVLSGNDASVVIAETLSPDGTEAGFAQQMTQRARALGMTNTVMKNSSGWPADGHVMSMRDLALLTVRLIEDFPEFYPMFAETEFAFDGRAPQNTRNRNPLLGMSVGADGLKTGHTREAGYGLAGSAVQGDRRVVFVITGLDSAQARVEESRAIINWAFRQFAQRDLAGEGQVIAEADVWMGAERRVGLVAGGALSALLPVLDADQVAAEVVYTGPIRAPIEKGQQLAELVLAPAGLPETRVPLFADRAIERGGFAVRVGTASQTLLRKLQDGPEGAF